GRLRAGPRPVPVAGRVQPAPNHLVAEGRQVLDAAGADRHDRVLLQVVPLARDVGADLHLVRQAHTRDLAESRVRLLRGRRVHARADAALLGRAAQGRGLRLGLGGLPTLPDELIDGGHRSLLETVDVRCGLTQERSAGPMALPTGRRMVANGLSARKPDLMDSGRNPDY